MPPSSHELTLLAILYLVLNPTPIFERADFVSGCQFCDKSFTNQGNMQVHQRVHTGEKPYSCSACGKSYAQKVGLKIHLEQCEAYRTGRTSESPVNVDTDSDSSDSSRKIDFSLPNIYASEFLSTLQSCRWFYDHAAFCNFERGGAKVCAEI
ncbi:unnamed protein product [Strongylus vulgaris]|uniref:C2H2-type domain-containing protein n=1 Tax=Strongylus vulgaris TaxID=40348 RepID=A0A3P7ID88_STRVU|nr:unnamed protein product [Strongylus vulgaris]